MPYIAQATPIPARPSATARTDESASCQFAGSATASVGATGSSQFVSGCQNGANWIQPPITASTARIADGHEHRPRALSP